MVLILPLSFLPSKLADNFDLNYVLYTPMTCIFLGKSNKSIKSGLINRYYRQALINIGHNYYNLFTYILYMCIILFKVNQTFTENIISITMLKYGYIIYIHVCVLMFFNQVNYTTFLILRKL